MNIKGKTGVSVVWVEGRGDWQGEVVVRGGPELASLAVAAELAARMAAGGISVAVSMDGVERLKVSASTPVDLEMLELAAREILARPMHEIWRRR